MKETILKELYSRKLGIERQIEWHIESATEYDKIGESYFNELSCFKGKLTELKDIIFYVEGL